MFKFLLSGFIAFLCEYFDSSIGMGYGTTLTPILVALGFSPIQVVPGVLLSQFVAGFTLALLHHRAGHVRFDFSRDEEAVKRRLSGWGYIPKSRDAKVAYVLSGFGIMGALLAVFSAISLPSTVVKIYIGLMVFSIGIFLLIRKGKGFSFSWGKFTFIAILSAFNKGISGGGYGPVVIGGQVLTGRETKSAIGITALAESIVAMVAFLGYLILKPHEIDLRLALFLLAGAILSTPFSVFTVKKFDSKKLKYIISIALCILGIITILRGTIWR
jgi:hypothetical protein